MKKVLFVVPSMVSFGGVEKLLVTLAQLLEEDFVINIASFDRFGATPCFPTAAHFYPLGQCKNWPLPFRFITYIGTARRLAALKKVISPDLTVSLLWRADLMNALTKQKKEKIASLAVINIVNNKSNLLLMRFAGIVGVVYRRFHRILAITPLILEEFKSLYNIDPERLSIFRTFVHPERQVAKLSDNSSRFVFCGRAVHEKNIEGLLYVFRLFSERHHGRQLVIIGDGPLLCSMILLAEELGLSVSTDSNSKAQVLFVGSRETPECFMWGARAFLLTSRHEGLPTVLILAAALGLPFLAADSEGGGVRYLLSQTTSQLGCFREGTSFDLSESHLPVPDPKKPITLELWVQAIELIEFNISFRNNLIKLSSEISKIYSRESVKAEWLSFVNLMVNQ